MTTRNIYTVFAIMATKSNLTEFKFLADCGSKNDAEEYCDGLVINARFYEKNLTVNSRLDCMNRSVVCQRPLFIQDIKYNSAFEKLPYGCGFLIEESVITFPT